MSDDSDELRSLAARVRTNLALRSRSGLAGVPTGKSRRSLAVVAPTAKVVVPSVDDDATTTRPTGAAGLQLAREELGDCQRCKLSQGRTNIVFGVGNPEAHLVFVGEAPGADEDAQGEPFVGKAGQLLNKMIEAMGYRREDVYICNVVKC
ncbi:MAG TPA: uracil-DNA glycosylase, partial [Polyangia bacterium]